MSHSELDKAVFASAREWRRLRARIAADVRHGNDGRAQELRAVLPLLRWIAWLRAVTECHPGIFELGARGADSFYEQADQWGSILVPSAFQAPSP
jgi:hypothetical protein